MTIKLSDYEPTKGQEDYHVSQLTRDLAPWSVSRAKTAKRCPLQFKWKYIDKREPDPDVSAEDLALRMGSTMHLLYEHIFNGLPKKQAYIDAVTEVGLGKDEQESMRPMISCVSWFVDSMKDFISAKVDTVSDKVRFKELVAKGLIGVEKRFSLDEDFAVIQGNSFNKEGTFIRGVIDLILLTEDGKGAVIIDHKSAQYTTLKWHQEQLNVYALAALSMYPNIEWVQCGIHFMPKKTLKWNPVVGRDEKESFKRKVHYFLNMAANEALTEEMKIGGHCSKWCPFLSSCKALRKERRRQAREEQKAAQ